MDRTYGIAPPGFRLPDATHVGTVRLQVSDLDRSLEYYGETLGLAPLTRDAAHATLGTPGAIRPLVALHERRGARPAPRRGAFGLYHFAILLPDRQSLGRFAAHLSRGGGLSGAADHLVSEALYLTDPDGLGIEVYADRPRETWHVHNRELTMTTDPLDMHGLIGAGGSESWTVMPAGTVMGHVHLHVGNLDQASAFYHAGLGFDRIVWSYPGALFLSAGGYHHHLGTNTWSPGPAAAADQARLLEWELIVPSRDAVSGAAASLAAAGYRVEDDGQDSFVAPDPRGTHVRVRPSHEP
jgi:catechol 2,3-dioxygenase